MQLDHSVLIYKSNDQIKPGAGASGNGKKQNSTSLRANKYIHLPEIQIFAIYKGKNLKFPSNCKLTFKFKEIKFPFNCKLTFKFK